MRDFKTVANASPHTAESKRNNIVFFTSAFKPVKARYIKVVAKNMETAPAWHNAARSPAWIFVDEVIVN
jgi:hexosaminidase